ncbi:MAG: hypothetical protein IPI77_16865 [Saprospiraceae bacterium]|nr:hypothetical protein [Saprospiraceae bacterium]
MTKLNYVPEQGTDFIFSTMEAKSRDFGYMTIVGLLCC